MELLGYLAGILTTLNAVPQLIKILRTGRANDVSVSSWMMLAVGSGLWVVYGISINSIPLILFDGIAFVLRMLVVVKVYQQRNADLLIHLAVLSLSESCNVPFKMCCARHS